MCTEHGENRMWCAEAGAGSFLGPRSPPPSSGVQREPPSTATAEPAGDTPLHWGRPHGQPLPTGCPRGLSETWGHQHGPTDVAWVRAVPLAGRRLGGSAAGAERPQEPFFRPFLPGFSGEISVAGVPGAVFPSHAVEQDLAESRWLRLTRPLQAADSGTATCRGLCCCGRSPVGPQPLPRHRPAGSSAV